MSMRKDQLNIANDIKELWKTSHFKFMAILVVLYYFINII